MTSLVRQLPHAVVPGLPLPVARTIAPAATAGRFRHALVVSGDVLGSMALVLCIPLAILAVGIPIALLVSALLRLVRVM